MDTSNRQVRRNRAFRLEFLESRQLLSSIGRPHHPVVDVSPVVLPDPRETITGSLSGSVVVTPIARSRFTASFTSSGTTGIGSSTFDGSVRYLVGRRLAVLYHSGTGTLANPTTGDQLHVVFSGTGSETSADTFTFSWRGQVRGGAGSFVHAAGTFAATGSFNSATRVFTISPTIELTRT